MKTLVERNELFLNRIIEADIHGMSYIFEISKKSQNENNNIEKYLLEEKERKIYDNLTYHEFNIKTQNIINNLTNELLRFKKDEYKCIGYGAAAKGQTVLCYANIFLDYIIDENPLKIGLYSPKMNIPIVDINYFINDTTDNIVVVILAWNFSNEIKEKIRKYKGKKNIYVVEAYFPEVIIRKLV
jgi:hypothetical protein